MKEPVRTPEWTAEWTPNQPIRSDATSAQICARMDWLADHTLTKRHSPTTDLDDCGWGMAHGHQVVDEMRIAFRSAAPPTPEKP